MRRFHPVLIAVAAAAAAIALAPSALADSITLEDGTRLTGTIVEEGPTEVVLEHEVGGATVRSTFKKSDLRGLEKSFGGGAGGGAEDGDAPAPVGTAERDPAPKGRDYAELARYEDRVIFVLDRSGSMSIADRFSFAVDELLAMVAALPEDTKFDVYVFDSKARSLFDGELMRPTPDFEAKLRGRLEKPGINQDGFTDLVDALRPAIERHPEAVYLLSDGVPTVGELETARVVAAVLDLARRHKVPVHVVGVLGGEYPFADIEDPEGARDVLRGIAQATGGRYREVEAAPRPGTRRALKRAFGEEEEGEDVAFRLWHGGKWFVTRELTFPKFQVEIFDPALVSGPFVLEYSVDLELMARTVTEGGVPFDERRLPLVYKDGRLWTPDTLKVVRPNDNSERNDPDYDDKNVVRLRIPTAGGVIELVYTRSGREYKEVILVRVPYTD